MAITTGLTETNVFADLAAGLENLRVDPDAKSYNVEEDLINWIESVLWIVAAREDISEIVPFLLNEDQRVFADWCQKQIKAGKSLNAIILKARQLGFSTLIAAIFFAITSTKENIESLIVSHVKESSDRIFRMTQLFYDHMPLDIKPMRTKRNARELVFENPKEELRGVDPGLRSRIEVETAQKDEVGRSGTFRLAHLSEIAFWRDPANALTSLLQTMPTEAPLTGMILESTANGVGNYFHAQWEQAERGEGRYTPFFFDWFKKKEYSKELTEDEKKAFTPDKTEERLQRRFKLTLEQLNWRRGKISEFQTLARSTTDPAKMGLTAEQLFQQEFPCEPIEAFLATGRPVFNREALSWYTENRVIEPKTIGNIVEDRRGKLMIDPDKFGYLKVWETPIPGEGYIVGADIAEGLGGGDFTSFHVMRQRNMQIVAHWHGHMDAGLAAEQLEMLGYFYNKAYIVPECNNQGLVICIHLQKVNYPRIYMRQTLGRRNEQVREEVGWQTSTATKPVLINHLANEIRDKTFDLPDEATVAELNKYVRDEKGRFGAQPGSNDDRVISLALCVEGHRTAPKMWGRRERMSGGNGQRRKTGRTVSEHTGY